MIEHLSNPVLALLEMNRVAGSLLVLSTEQFFADEDVRRARLQLRDHHQHFERNVYAPSDFELLFPGAELSYQSQCFIADQDLFSCAGEPAQLVRRLMLDEQRSSAASGGGVIVVRKKQGERARAPRTDVGVLAQWLIEPQRVVAERDENPPLWRGFRSPVCHGELSRVADGDGLACATGCCTWPSDEGPLDLFVDDPLDVAAAIAEKSAALADGDDLGTWSSALVALDDLFSMPFVSTSTWDFDAQSRHADWTLYNLEPGEGHLRARHDPQLISPWIGASLTEGLAIEVDYELRDAGPPGPSTTLGEIFLVVDGDMDFTQARSLDFAIPLMDGRGTVRRRLEIPARLVAAARYLVRVRLDPMPGRGLVTVRRVSLVPA